MKRGWVGVVGFAGAMRVAASGYGQSIRTLTVVTNPVEGGKIYVSPLSTAPGGELYKYTNGTQIHVTASPAAGFRFAGFSGMPLIQQVMLNINSDDHVTANFEQNGAEVFTVEASAEGEGTVEMADSRFESGWLTVIRAKPNAGSYFSHWTGVGPGENPLRNPLFTGIYSNRNLVAHFTTNQVEGQVVIKASRHPAGHLSLEWDKGSNKQ